MIIRGNSKKERTCSKLLRKVAPRFSGCSFLIMILCIFILLAGYFGSWYYETGTWREDFRDCKELLQKFQSVNSYLITSSESLYNYIFTFSTVVAAVVVLYYTLQDSYREGIPHRKVVA